MCSSFSERNNSGPGGGRNVLAVCGSMCVGGITRTFGAAAVCGEPCGEVVHDLLSFYALLMGLGVAGPVDVTRISGRRALQPDRSPQAMQIHSARPSSVRAADPVADFARELHYPGVAGHPAHPEQFQGRDGGLVRCGHRGAIRAPGQEDLPRRLRGGGRDRAHRSCASRRSLCIETLRGHGVQSRGHPYG